jgi:hypothetical protein
MVLINFFISMRHFNEQSTMAKSLADKLGLPVYYEPVADNEYLTDFYSDIKTYSFPMQVGRAVALSQEN